MLRIRYKPITTQKRHTDSWSLGFKAGTDYGYRKTSDAIHHSAKRNRRLVRKEKALMQKVEELMNKLQDRNELLDHAGIPYE